MIAACCIFRGTALAVAARDLDIAREGIAAKLPRTAAICLTASWRTAACSRAPAAAKARLARRWFAAFRELVPAA